MPDNWLELMFSQRCQRIREDQEAREARLGDRGGPAAYNVRTEATDQRRATRNVDFGRASPLRSLDRHIMAQLGTSPADVLPNLQN